MIPALLKKNAIKIIDIDDLDSGFSRFSWIISKLQDPFIKYFDLITVHNDELYKRFMGIKSKEQKSLLLFMLEDELLNGFRYFLF